MTPPPSSERGQSLTLDLPRESRRSFILRRDGSRDEAGAGYDLQPGLVDVELEGVGKIGDAIRLNASSIWFDPTPRTQIPYGQLSRVILRTAEGTFGPFNTMIGVQALNDDVHAVARLRDVSLSGGRELVAFMLSAAEKGHASPVRPMATVQTDITDPVRVRVVLESLAHRMASAVFNCDGKVVKASLSSFDAGRGTLFWVVNDRTEIGLFGATGEAEVAGYNCVYHMRFASVSQAAFGVLTSIPERVDYSRYRRYRRAAIAGDVSVRFNHPLWPEIPAFDRPLIDVSFGGIAFAAHPLEDALYVGLRVESIEVTGHGGDPISLRGTVRSLVRLADGTMTCGLSVEPRTPELTEAWASFVMQSLNQTTAPGDDHVEKLWELYRDSGYFSLSGKDPHEFDALSASFRSLMERTKTKAWLSYNSVWPSSRRIEASVSTLKVYRNTWMLHQLAKRKATQGDPRARHILRDIYLRAFEYMQTDPKCQWVLSYAEAHVRWVQGSHIAFAEHFEATGAATARSFRLMEVSCLEPGDGPADRGYRVGAMAQDEQALIVDVLQETLPAPYLEAADLVKDRFDLSGVRQAWADVGLSRAREVWVARYRSEPVAAAIMESAETGTNLFRLTDSLRLVALQPGGEDAFVGLIERAKAWFLERGKDSFVYFWERFDDAHVRAARLRDLGEGRMWVIRSDLIPDFLELVCELTSHSGSPEPGRPDSAVPGPVAGHLDVALPHSLPMNPPESVRGVGAAGPGGAQRNVGPAGPDGASRFTR